MGGNDFLKLKVPEHQKNDDWYKYQADRLIPSAEFTVVREAPEMDKLYRLLNNDLTGFEQELKAYCSDLSDYGAVEEELIPYNPLPNKIEALKGNMLTRGNTYRLMLLNAKAIRRKDSAFQERIKASVSEELRLTLEKQKAQMEGMSKEEQDQYIESIRSEIPLTKLNKRTFLTQAEITFSKLIQYTEATQEVRSKKTETLEDAALVSRLFVLNTWRNGKPAIEVLNPKNIGFAKSPSEEGVEKGDFWWYRDYITMGDALDEYINILKPEEVVKLAQYGQLGNPVTSDHVTKPVFDQTRFYSILEAMGEQHSLIRDEGLHQGNQLTKINFNYLVPRVHLEFKAYEEVIFLTYRDELGEPITKRLNGKAAIIPAEATKLKTPNKYHQDVTRYSWTDEQGIEYEAEVMWIPRRYEVVRLGQDIYVHRRKVPFQPEYENPFNDFELSLKGLLLYNRNAKSLSLVQRAVPYIFQYMSARRVQNRELAKFVGQEKVVDVDQIYEELGADHGTLNDIDPALIQEIIARKTGTRFVSTSKMKNGLAPPTTRGRPVEYQVVDTTAILLNLEAFCTEIDRKIGIRMGIPAIREGVVESRTTATDNRQSLFQGDIMTMSLYYAIDKVWAKALNEHLRNLVTLIDGHFRENPMMEDYQLETILPDGSREFFAVTKADIKDLKDIGLYQYDTGKEKMYFDMMMQNIFSFAQNAGEGVEVISSVLKALTTTTSIEEMHEIIRQTTDELRQRSMEEQQAQMKQAEAMRQAQLEMMREQAQLQLEGKLAEIDRRSAADLDRAMVTSETLAKQYDIDRNKVNDMLQQQEMKDEHDSAERAKDRAHESLEAAKDRASKEKIAKMKPKGGNNNS